MESEPVPSPDVEAHLERVLASATFRGADRSRRLLRFVVEQTLQGQADRLKDYTLGAEALGRGDDFDPRTDPIARVEMSRLRSRLDVYYATEGTADELRIVVAKGGYVPLFQRRSPLVPQTPAEDAAAAAVPSTLTSTGRSSSRWWMLVAPLVAAALAAVTTWWIVQVRSSPAHAAEIHLELTTPATTDPASLAVAPDGQAVAFVASDGDVPRVWLRSLGATSAHPLAGTEHASFPFWSPDGRAIGFFAEGRVKAIDLQTRLVRTLSTAPVPAGAAWNRDGAILHPLVPDSPLFRTTASGGSLEPATQLAAGETGHRGPVFLPDGRRFLYYVAGTSAVRGIYVGELGTFRNTRLLDADAPAVFVPPAHLLYLQHATLLAQPFDPATATLHGEPVTVIDGLALEPSAGLAAVAASSGTIAYEGVRSVPSGSSSGSIGPAASWAALACPKSAGRDTPHSPRTDVDWPCSGRSVAIRISGWSISNAAPLSASRRIRKPISPRCGLRAATGSPMPRSSTASSSCSRSRRRAASLNCCCARERPSRSLIGRGMDGTSCIVP